jgi:hypothetical protein
MSRKFDIDKMQGVVDKLVTEAKLSDEDYDEMYEAAAKEIQDMGTVPEEMQEYYTLKRVQLALKMRFSSSSSEMEGFFIAQHPTFDFAEKPHKIVSDYVDKMGKQKAMELGIIDSTLTPLVYYIDSQTGAPVDINSIDDEEADRYEEAGPLAEEELDDMIYKLGRIEAVKHKYMNSEGEPLYVNDQYREGQVIPAHDWSRVGYAVVKAPGEEELKMAFVNMRGDTALNGVPLFKFGRFSGRINQRKSGPNHYEMSMKNAFTVTGDEVDYWDYDEVIESLIPERCLDGLDEIEGFVKSRPREFKRWCIAQGDIMVVGTPTNGVVPITVTDYSLSSFKANESELTFWLEQDMLSGLQENILDAMLILAPYVKKDGTVSGNCIGYWIDPMFRAEAPDEVGEEDVLNSW